MNKYLKMRQLTNNYEAQFNTIMYDTTYEIDKYSDIGYLIKDGLLILKVRPYDRSIEISEELLKIIKNSSYDVEEILMLFHKKHNIPKYF